MSTTVTAKEWSINCLSIRSLLTVSVRNFASVFLTFPSFSSPFSVICGSRRLSSLFVGCVQYNVDLLPFAAAAKSSLAFCPHNRRRRRRRRQRRSAPFNNPLSHFCVSEEGRERGDCRVPEQRRAGAERAVGGSECGIPPREWELRLCLERSSENRGMTGGKEE